MSPIENRPMASTSFYQQEALPPEARIHISEEPSFQQEYLNALKNIDSDQHPRSRAISKKTSDKDRNVITDRRICIGGKPCMCDICDKLFNYIQVISRYTNVPILVKNHTYV